MLQTKCLSNVLTASETPFLMAELKAVLDNFCSAETDNMTNTSTLCSD